MIAENALGNPVHSTTRTKINQTWLASQTGPIERSICARTFVPRSPLPASKSQTPAPKSAPPKMAYRVTPVQRMAAQTSAVLMLMPPDYRRLAAHTEDLHPAHPSANG